MFVASRSDVPERESWLDDLLALDYVPVPEQSLGPYENPAVEALVVVLIADAHSCSRGLS
jgi:hypothetical protein